MNLHTKLIGALDAVILGLTGAVTLALLLALVDPIASTRALERQTSSDRALAEHPAATSQL